MIAAKAGGHRALLGLERLGPPGRLAVALAALAAGLITLRTAQTSPGFSYLTESAVAEVVGMGVGWGLVAVGLETLRRGRRRRFGKLLALAGIAWFLPDWSDPAIGTPVGFTLGLVLGWSYPAVLGHALLKIAGAPRSSRLDPVIVVTGYVLFIIGLGVIPAIGFDPRAAGCGFCPANLIDVGGSSSLVDIGTRLATVLAVGWTLSAALLLARRLVGSGLVARQVRAPILIPGIGFLVVVAFTLGRTAIQVVAPTDTTDHVLRLVQAIFLAAMTIGIASEWLRARRSRARVARVVADLGESPPVGGLRDHLASILRDSELQLAYPVGGGALVDASGRPLPAEPLTGRTTTPVIRDGRVVAIIDHGLDVLRDPGDVDEVVAAARLGLEHERLQAEARAQLGTLRAARRRIVEAGDAYRRQLERDLHDGAQQHLIALSINLRFVERTPDVAGWIDDAATELRRALDDLREVAHGIYPTVLGDEGFAAAVDALAETSAVPITIVEMVEERFALAIEVAAYHVVADAVRGGVGPFWISARRDREQLTVEVRASQILEDVAEDVADRVGAVDGTTSIVRAGGSATLVAEIPCAS